MSKVVKNEFEIISGTNNIILVAPHGYPGDDDNTGQLTRLLAERLNCYAIINKVYRRTNWTEIKGVKVQDSIDLYCNDVDMNNVPQIEQAGLEKKWLGTIEEFKEDILKKHSYCVAFFIHGAKDKNVKEVNDQADVLFGVGRVKPESEKNDRPTASEETVNELIKVLLQQEPSITAAVAKAAKKHSDDIENRYAGWDQRNLNQLFTARNKKYADNKVESIQLEFKKTDFRDNEDNVKATAEKLALAIQQLPGIAHVAEQANDVGKEVATTSAKGEVMAEPEIIQATNKIIEIVQNSFASGLIEVGDMLIKVFFDDDFWAARERKKRKGNPSILQVHRELKSRGITSVSQGWLYNAIKVAADSRYIESKQDFFDLQTYENLSASHKVLIESVKNDEQKRMLILEAAGKKYSFIELKNRIAEIKALTAPKQEKSSNRSILRAVGNPASLFSGDFDSTLKPSKLKALRPSTRAKLKIKIESKIPALDATIQEIESNLEKQKNYLVRYQNLATQLNKIPEGGVQKQR